MLTLGDASPTGVTETDVRCPEAPRILTAGRLIEVTI